jgi:hypothetical protein
MEDIIKAIDNALDVEKKVEAFFVLPDDEKRALLEKLQNVKTETLGIFLNAIYPEEKDKNIQKLIRKLLFKLKSAGVRVEEPKTTGETVLKKIEEIRGHRGFLTNYDEMQTMLVAAGFEIKKNTYAFINAEIHFSKGLTGLMSAPVDKKGLEGILEAYRKDTKPPRIFEEISPAYATYLVEEGSNRSGKFRDEIRTLKSFAANIAGGIHKPKDIYSLPLSDTSDTATPETIFAHTIFKPFFISWDSLEEDRKTYNNAGGSMIVLPPYMAEEKKSEFLKGLTERNDMKSMLPFLKRMTEDYAYLFYCMKEFNHYKGLIEYLNNEDAPKETLSYFLKKSLEKGEEKQQNRGLIVNPYG